MKKLMVLALATTMTASFAAEANTKKKTVKKSKTKKSKLVKKSKKSKKTKSETTLATNTFKRDFLQNGFRVGLSTGRTDMEMELEITNGPLKGSKADDSETADMRTLTLGYSKIERSAMGFAVALNLSTLEFDDIDLTKTGIEGNLTYGINNQLYTYGGLNLSRLSTDDNSSASEFYDDLGVGTGLQLALGVQINKNIAGEIKYQNTVHLAEVSQGGTKADLDVTTSGLQIGVLGTF